MLDRDVYSTAEFKKMSQYFVFCKINADYQPAVKNKYGVSGLPTIVILTADATEVTRFVGYRPLAEFLKALEGARG